MNRQNVLLTSVLVLTFLVLSPALRNGWTNLDDPIYILENNLIKELSWESIRQMFTTFQVNGSYNPLVLLSWAVDYHFSELSPSFYHYTNLFLHLIVVSLVFYLALLLSKNKWVAFGTSLLFGIHPMHVEAVAWVTARKDLLYTLFYILGLIAYYFYQENKAHSYKWYYFFLCFMCYVLSLFSKGSAITFPLILWAMDYLKKRKDIQLLFFEKIPFIILSIVFTYISIKAQDLGEALQFRAFYSVFDSLSVGFYGYLDYLIKLVVPYRLSGLHPYPTPSGTPVPWYFSVAAIPVLAIAGYCISKIRTNRTLVFGFAFFFITLIPVIQVLSFAISVTADRFTYLPYFGLFYLITIGIVWIMHNRPKFKKLSIVLVTGFLLFLSIKTFSYSKIWKNSDTVWSRVIKFYPDYFVSYVNRAAYRIEIGQLEKALKDCDKAIILKPNYYLAYYNRGYIYSKLGNIEKAIDNYTQTITLNNNSFQAYQNRGILYVQLNRLDDAYSDFNRAVLLKPKDPLAFLNRASLFEETQNYIKAIDDASTAISLDSTLSKAYYLRGTSYIRIGQKDKAIIDFTKAIEYNSNMVSAYTKRGILLFNFDNFPKALKDFDQAIKRDDSQTDAYIYKSRIMLRQSRYDDALFNLSRAEKMDPNNHLIYYYRSIIYQRKEDYKTALKVINKSLIIQPNDSLLIMEKESIKKKLNDNIE